MAKVRRTCSRSSPVQILLATPRVLNVTDASAKHLILSPRSQGFYVCTTWGGATVHVATDLTDRVAFIAGNDVETGNPVGSEDFIASRDGGVGVLGVSANSLGNGFGVFGDSESPQGIGVLGRNSATSGDPVGVLGATASHDRGIGVRGRAESQDGSGIGVLGEVESPDGVAVFGNGFRVGVQGIARAT